MSINIDEINDPDRFDSKHWVHFKVGGDKEVIQITGVCLFDQLDGDEESPDEWQRESVYMLIKMPVEPLNGRFFLVESSAPLVTINTIASDPGSNDTGLGVDQFECRIEDAVLEFGDVFPITARVVIRNRGARLMRLGYSVTLLCSTLEERPPAEDYY
jgi:hypothetical protein